MSASHNSTRRQELDSALRLVQLSAEALLTHFVRETDFDEGSPRFAGFLRDSEASIDGLRTTTGALQVYSRLLSLEQDLAYVSVGGSELSRVLSELRVAASEGIEHFYRETRELDVFFGERNHYRPTQPVLISHASHVVSRARRMTSPVWTTIDPIAAFFWAVNLERMLDVLEDESSHPYALELAWGAVCELSHEEMSHLQTRWISGDESSVVTQALRETRAFGGDELPGSAAQLRERLRKVTVDDWRLMAMPGIRSRAHAYIERQLGLSATRQRVGTDPAGVAVALGLVCGPSYSHSTDDEIIAFALSEAGVIEAAIQLVFQSVTPQGHLPFGAPFFHTAASTGAFTPSATALTLTLSAVLRLLRAARANDYPTPVVGLLQRALDHKNGGTEHLAGIGMSFETSIGRRRIGPGLRLRRDRFCKGWASDRSPGVTRTESWVTVEVLAFAVYLREVLHELAQMDVCRRFGAICPRTTKRLPVKDTIGTTTAAPHTPSRADTLVDPDLEDSGGAIEQLVRLFELENELGVPVKQSWRREAATAILYGPPGVAKTTLAKSLANHLGWQYLELSPGQFVLEGVERIEFRASDIFESLTQLREAVILLDELDSLIVSRDSVPIASPSHFLVPSMLPKLQALSSHAKSNRVIVVMNTNYYERLDAAAIRGGRVDLSILVLPPNQASRAAILSREFQVRGSTVSAETIGHLARASSLYIYEELVKLARSLSDADLTAWNSSRPVLTPDIGADLYEGRFFRLQGNPEGGRTGVSDRLALNRLASEFVGVASRLVDMDARGSDPLEWRLEMLNRKLHDSRVDSLNTTIQPWARLASRVKNLFEGKVF